MKTILVALDFSDVSKTVLDAACSMAIAHNAVLHILHVMEPEPIYTAYGMTPEEYPVIHTYRAETQKRAEARVNDAVAEARKLLPDVRAELMVGSPKHCIMEYAQAHAIDLIVIGTHGHGAVAALLLGSVAEGLVRKAFCPTLVIPAIHS